MMSLGTYVRACCIADKPPRGMGTNGGALSGLTPSGFPLVIVASRPVGYSPGEAPETGAGGRASVGSGEGERDWPPRDRTTSTLCIYSMYIYIKIYIEREKADKGP